MAMQEFVRGECPDVTEQYIQDMAEHLDESVERVREAVAARLNEVVWINDKYQVNVTEGEGNMIWLSIKRIDKQPIHDWRDLQEIKNKLVGPENEAVEIYPAESRLVDTANQYHLWVFRDPEIRLPFGFNDGRKVQYESAVGAVQRPQGDRS